LRLIEVLPAHLPNVAEKVGSQRTAHDFAAERDEEIVRLAQAFADMHNGSDARFQPRLLQGFPPSGFREALTRLSPPAGEAPGTVVVEHHQNSLGVAIVDEHVRHVDPPSARLVHAEGLPQRSSANSGGEAAAWVPE